MPGHSPIIAHISIYHSKPRKSDMYLGYQTPYLHIRLLENRWDMCILLYLLRSKQVVQHYFLFLRSKNKAYEVTYIIYTSVASYVAP